uniref:(California timema) hypothetical protein n=1 Tax=Timema californicum TaxID=61474 RepID=A0A7R9PCD3_TIMCA|nr:unnamed protein product [Timema californicum]
MVTPRDVTVGAVCTWKLGNSSNRKRLTLVLAAYTASRRSIRYAAVVKNLSVRTILFQPVPRFLQLSVSWDIPSGAGIISPKGYVLSILPNNDSSCPQEPGYCPSDNFIYQVIYDPNTTNIIVPDKPERHDVLKIVTECCYNVTLWSTPHNGSTRAFLNYTVPECTGDVCSCSERHRPPNARVTSATVQTNTTVNVTWELLHNDSRTSNINTFIVRFGPFAMRSSANKPVFNISHVQNVSADLSMKGPEFSAILYVPDMTNTQYKVEVIARNRRGCSSQPAEYIFLSKY